MVKLHSVALKNKTIETKAVLGPYFIYINWSIIEADETQQQDDAHL